MGKHKNQQQVAILIQFMEEYPDLAKGFTKRDKSLVNHLWQQLTDALNATGPPTKDVNGWKKVWSEWKSEVKKKLAHNASEARVTGGGPFRKYNISENEESIIRICGMTRAVEGVPGMSLGDIVESGDESDDIPTTSTKRRAETPRVANTPKRHKSYHISQRLSTFLDEDSDNKKDPNKLMTELVKVQKENASSLRRVYRDVEKSTQSFENTVAELKNEVRHFSTRILTAIQEKNELKRKQLELETLKFEYKSKNE